MYLAVLVLQRGLFTFIIDRTDPGVLSDMESLIEAEKAFWHCVEEGLPPEIDGSDSTMETLGVLHKVESDDLADLCTYDGELEQLEAIRNKQKELKEMQSEIEARIKEYLVASKAQSGIASGFKVTWKPQKSSRIDTARLKKERPDIAAEYTKVIPSQPFKVTKRKGANA